MFSRRKSSSRPYWRRGPPCQSSSDTPSGGWCLESFAVLPCRLPLAATAIGGGGLAHLPVVVQRALAAPGLHTGLPRAAPRVPAPLVPRDAAEVGESRRGGDAEPRRAPDAVDHDEDGVGDVVLRDRDAAAAAAGNDARRAAAERVQCHGGGAAILRPQAEPGGDGRGRRAGVLARPAVK